jgi:hypothetical protein
VRRCSLCRMGFGQTHGMHTIFLKFMSNSSHSNCSSCPFRALTKKWKVPCAPCVSSLPMPHMGLWRTVGGASACKLPGVPPAAPRAFLGGGMAGVILCVPACQPGPVLGSYGPTGIDSTQWPQQRAVRPIFQHYPLQPAAHLNITLGAKNNV